MTLKPERLGDRGQRYQIEVKDYPKEGWNVFGWCETEEAAVRMANNIRKVPGATASRIVDRRE